MHPSRRSNASPEEMAPEEMAPEEITPELLHRWPLPPPDQAGDKEERGRVLVVGGDPEVPGGVLLAGTAVLRAGAGKLQIGTAASIAARIGIAIPEARVFALPERDGGGLAVETAGTLAARAKLAQVVLFGPGVVNEAGTAALLHRLLPHLTEPAVVLDAGALAILCHEPHALRHLEGRAIVTPHAGEMAHLLNEEKTRIVADPRAFAVKAARAWGAVVALKGAETYIAGADGRVFVNRAGNVGLATSGSGDVLSGLIAGLTARGAEPLQAAVWGVYLHARAGDLLAERIGPVGFLARELLPEIPRLMHHLSTPPPAEKELI